MICAPHVLSQSLPGVCLQVTAPQLAAMVAGLRDGVGLLAYQDLTKTLLWRSKAASRISDAASPSPTAPRWPTRPHSAYPATRGAPTALTPSLTPALQLASQSYPSPSDPSPHWRQSSEPQSPCGQGPPPAPAQASRPGSAQGSRPLSRKSSDRVSGVKRLAGCAGLVGNCHSSCAFPCSHCPYRLTSFARSKVWPEWPVSGSGFPFPCSALCVFPRSLFP